MKPKLTRSQKDVLSTIKRFIDLNGIPPTRAEIAKTLVVYPNAVQEFLIILERKGYVKLLKGISRGIVLID